MTGTTIQICTSVGAGELLLPYVILVIAPLLLLPNGAGTEAALAGMWTIIGFATALPVLTPGKQRGGMNTRGIALPISLEQISGSGITMAVTEELN